jgi:ketosteroid isomerase-like protein
MTTRETIQAYFDKLKAKGDWPSLLAEDVAFASFTIPVRRIDGRAAFLESTKRFYGSIAGMELRTLLVEGDRGCALTHYTLRSPVGSSFESDVAELFTVHDSKIVSFDIYFDSAPFPK